MAEETVVLPAVGSTQAPAGRLQHVVESQQFTVPLLICTLGTLGTIVVVHTTLATVVNILVAGNAVAAVAVIVALVAQGNTSARRSTV